MNWIQNELTIGGQDVDNIIEHITAQRKNKPIVDFWVTGYRFRNAKVDENTIKFESATDAVTEIISELAWQYPKNEFAYSWKALNGSEYSGNAHYKDGKLVDSYMIDNYVATFTFAPKKQKTEEM